MEKMFICCNRNNQGATNINSGMIFILFSTVK